MLHNSGQDLQDPPGPPGPSRTSRTSRTLQDLPGPSRTQQDSPPLSEKGEDVHQERPRGGAAHLKQISDILTYVIDVSDEPTVSVFL